MSATTFRLPAAPLRTWLARQGVTHEQAAELGGWKSRDVFSKQLQRDSVDGYRVDQLCCHLGIPIVLVYGDAYLDAPEVFANGQHVTLTSTAA